MDIFVISTMSSIGIWPFHQIWRPLTLKGRVTCHWVWGIFKNFLRKFEGDLWGDTQKKSMVNCSMGTWRKTVGNGHFWFTGQKPTTDFVRNFYIFWKVSVRKLLGSFFGQCHSMVLEKISKYRHFWHFLLVLPYLYLRNGWITRRDFFTRIQFRQDLEKKIIKKKS